MRRGRVASATVAFATAAGAIAVAAGVSACSEERARDTPASCTSWRPVLESEIADRCVACHGGDQPAGDYDLSTYNGALGPGTDDVANAIAGDATSAIVTYLDPQTADEVHAEHAALYDQVRDWVVDCDVSYFASRIHEPGLLDPASADFHGAVLRASSYDFALCAKCHGEDFGGGEAGVACTKCHAEGPTGCSTCHAAEPTTGAHVTHLAGGPLGKQYACTTCHVVPTAWDDPGHVFLADGSLDPPPADVVFDPIADTSLPGYDRAGPATYDPDTNTCTNVYCHGGALGDAAAAHPAPAWTDVGAGVGDCGSCHGAPPASHADDRCQVCHPLVAGADGALIDTTLHLDFDLSVGRSDDCGGCHGAGPEGAPPPDLAGGTSTQLVTVGAHRAHLETPLELRGPIPCSDCHTMPDDVTSAGHIDSAAPAEVFPGGAMFAGLAAAGGAVPAWDRESATCSDVYCHGGGTTRLADDTSDYLVREPVWTATGQAQATCGRCHGVPPVDGFHNPTLALTDCFQCHGSTVDPLGNIIVTGPPGMETSTHMDGNVP